MKNKHVIVISYDAFGAVDWAHAKKQPNMQRLLSNGCYTTNVKSVYPSLTYVVHSSYVTGVHPAKHGVYHNNPFQPFVHEQDQAWHWYRKDIQVPTIYEAIRKAGYTICSLLWPVTGKAAIQYNIPEIRAVKNENQILKILKNGSPLYSVGMELKYGKIRQGITQPYLDDFTTAIIVDTIKRKKPNLLMAHLIDLDDTKHLYGTKGTQIPEVIERMDRRLGDIIDSVEMAGIMDDTTFIIVGDHSQLEVQYMIRLNYLFMERGLIFEKNGTLHWRAYVQGADGSAFLHLQPNDTEAESIALNILNEVLEDESYGIEAIYNREQLDALHVPTKFRYMLEAKEGYCFDDELSSPVIYDLHAHNEKFATHGYLPNKPGYTSVFVASGAGIQSGAEIEEMCVIDLAPILAHLFEVEFPCDGHAPSQIFK